MSIDNQSSTRWETINRSNSVRVMCWTAGWVLSVAVAAFGPRFLWDFHTVPTVLGIIFNVCIGFGMVLAVKKQLAGMDELHRKIFMDASAITLGVGLVCGLSYELLEDIRLITFQPEIPHLVIVMCLTFLASTVLGHRKYS